MSKKGKKKWNRCHEFQWHKRTKSRNGHPAFIYARSGDKYRYLLFTHSSQTDGKQNEKLKHNIDPLETDKDSYLRPKHFVSHKDDFDPPKKKFYIHQDDLGTVKKYKKYN